MRPSRRLRQERSLIMSAAESSTNHSVSRTERLDSGRMESPSQREGQPSNADRA
jgi:hypothetical protein